MTLLAGGSSVSRRLMKSAGDEAPTGGSRGRRWPPRGDSGKRIRDTRPATSLQSSSDERSSASKAERSDDRNLRGKDSHGGGRCGGALGVERRVCRSFFPAGRRPIAIEPYVLKPNREDSVRKAFCKDASRLAWTQRCGPMQLSPATHRNPGMRPTQDRSFVCQSSTNPQAARVVVTDAPRLEGIFNEALWST